MIYDICIHIMAKMLYKILDSKMLYKFPYNSMKHARNMRPREHTHQV